MTEEKWEYKKVCVSHRVVVRNGSIDHTIARCGSGSEDEDNARRIVHCVNNHDALLEALRRYGEHEPGCMKGDACNCGLEQALQAAKDKGAKK